MNDFLLLFCDLYIKEKLHNKFVSSAYIFDFLSKKHKSYSKDLICFFLNVTYIII